MGAAALEHRMNETVEKVLRGFDFDKVHRVMVLVDWKWHIAAENQERVPTRDELYFAARELLEKAWLSDGSYRSGGFTAEKTQSNTCGTLKDELWLSFTLERSWTEAE